MVLSNIINKVKSTLDHDPNRTQYKNLVFSGGGVRGIAYLGALEVLDGYKILENIQRVAGTSAGAITATFISFGLNIQETKEIFNTLDVTKVPQEKTDSKERNLFNFAKEESTRRFLQKFGWYSSEYFYQWLMSVIADQCQGNSRATFRDFKERGFRDLYIVATNVSRRRAEVFSTDRTPSVAVADAVRMSMSIPIFFEALQYDGQKFGSGDYYVDGGLYNNFPIHLFDRPDFASKTSAYRDGVNLETLGLILLPDQLRSQSEPEIPENVWEFLTLIFQNIYQSYEMPSYQVNHLDQDRTIQISDCGIPVTDFEIEAGNDHYQMLYEAGKTAVQDFFNSDSS